MPRKIWIEIARAVWVLLFLLTLSVTIFGVANATRGNILYAPLSPTISTSPGARMGIIFFYLCPGVPLLILFGWLFQHSSLALRRIKRQSTRRT